MTTGTLIFSLLAGICGAVLVWGAARALCARLSAGAAARNSAPGRNPPEDAAGSGSGRISPEQIRAVYRRVFRRRMGGLFLCLAALAVWFMGAHWLASLFLAGAGCVLQYLAYRLRTCYALSMARQKQEQQMEAMTGAAKAESPEAPAKKECRCPTS